MPRSYELSHVDHLSYSTAVVVVIVAVAVAVAVGTCCRRLLLVWFGLVWLLLLFWFFIDGFNGSKREEEVKEKE